MVVRLVLGNTELLALSRWFLVVAPFLGALAARQPQLSPWLVRVLGALERAIHSAGSGRGLRPGPRERIEGAKSSAALMPRPPRRRPHARHWHRQRRSMVPYGTYGIPPIGVIVFLGAPLRWLQVLLQHQLSPLFASFMRTRARTPRAIVAGSQE